jgi:NAD-dependent DNA ligase
VLESDKDYLERAKLFVDSPDNGIVGKVFTLTGKLDLGTRSKVMGIIEGLGGGYVKSTSRNTNVLVQGTENPNSFAPGHDHSSSYEMAEVLRGEGFEIETIFEDQFVELIPGEFFQRSRN